MVQVVRHDLIEGLLCRTQALRGGNLTRRRRLRTYQIRNQMLLTLCFLLRRRQILFVLNVYLLRQISLAYVNTLWYGAAVVEAIFARQARRVDHRPLVERLNLLHDGKVRLLGDATMECL